MFFEDAHVLHTKASSPIRGVSNTYDLQATTKELAGYSGL